MLLNYFKVFLYTPDIYLPAGFNSLFLYRRLYRCRTTLDTFYTEGGNVERIKDISLKDFYNEYDMKKPVQRLKNFSSKAALKIFPLCWFCFSVNN